MTWKHGLSGYTNHGCRCAVCRAANVDYHRGARVRRSQSIPPDRHGRYTTYANYGCRCEDCRRANTERERERKRRLATA